MSTQTPSSDRPAIQIREFADVTSVDGGSEVYQCRGCLEAHQRSWFYVHFRSCEKVQDLVREAEAKYTPHQSSVKRRRLASSSTADASLHGPVDALPCPDFGDASGDASLSDESPDMFAPLEAFRMVTNEGTGHQEAVASDEAGSEADLKLCISDTVSSHAIAAALATHECFGLPRALQVYALTSRSASAAFSSLTFHITVLQLQESEDAQSESDAEEAGPSSLQHGTLARPSTAAAQQLFPSDGQLGDERRMSNSLAGTIDSPPPRSIIASPVPSAADTPASLSMQTPAGSPRACSPGSPPDAQQSRGARAYQDNRHRKVTRGHSLTVLEYSLIMLAEKRRGNMKNRSFDRMLRYIKALLPGEDNWAPPSLHVLRAVVGYVFTLSHGFSLGILPNKNLLLLKGA